MKARVTKAHKSEVRGRKESGDVRRLLAALRLEAGEGAAARGLSDLSDADWKNLLLLAQGTFLGPLLSYRSERSGSLAAAPESVRAGIQREYCANAIRNTSFFNRLAIVLRALTEAGVEVIPLKGIHLAELVYGNRALRRIGDADLLVKVEDMAAAERVVRALGYTQKRAASFEAAIEVSQHVPPHKMAGSVDIELHWNTGNPAFGAALDEKGLWSRSRRAQIGGVEVRVLSPADLLLHLCMHLSVNHLFRGHLRAIFDISETLERHGGDMDWKDFRLGCANPGIAKGCWLALTLAAKHAGAKVPEEILNGLRPAGAGNGDSAVALAAAEKLLLYGGHLEISPMVSRLWGSYPIGDKVRHFMRRAFLTRSEMEYIYPVKGSSPMVYFFYLWRAVDLLSRYGGGVWRLLWSGKRMTEDTSGGLEENALRDWLDRG